MLKQIFCIGNVLGSVLGSPHKGAQVEAAFKKPFVFDPGKLLAFSEESTDLRGAIVRVWGKKNTRCASLKLNKISN